MNFSPNTFQSEGKWYTLNVTLSPDTEMFPNDTPVTLDGLGIEELSYISELNSLVMHGKIVYADKYGQVDKFLEQQQCICMVQFAENKVKIDGMIADSQIDEEHMFSHTFIADNIKMVERSEAVIKYEIDLVSWNWYKCMANIQFSNHGKPLGDENPMPLFKILSTCITSAGLNPSSQSFGKVQTKVKLEYATQANDNLFKVFPYLMDRLYFLSETDDSMKFLVYDQTNDAYGLLDVKDTTTYMGSSSTILSFFKTNAESLVNEMPSNIGSYLNGQSKTGLYTSMLKKSIYRYDFSSNSLSADKDSASEDALATYMNARMSDDFQMKYHPLVMPPMRQYCKHATYWNDAPYQYFDTVNAMYATGALALNTRGDILRQCGYIVNIGIDRNMNALRNMSAQELKDLKTKYIGFEGTWLAFKVVNVISPAQRAFRQQIALFRNYTKREKPSKETVVS